MPKSSPQAFEFNTLVKHGRFAFNPKVRYGFEDPDAVSYFAAMGWGKKVKGEPEVIIGLGDVDIDPETVFADGPKKGQKVLGG